MNFRENSLGWVRRVTFDYPLNLIAQNRKSDTKFGKVIVVEKPLAVASSRLLTGSSYQTISKVFGIRNQPFQLFTKAKFTNFLF